MTLERTLSLPASSDDISMLLQSPLQERNHLEKELLVGNIRYEKALDYVRGSDDDADHKINDGAATVFTAGMPGAMSTDELERDVDLSQWTLKLGGSFVPLEVSTTIGEGYTRLQECLKVFTHNTV